MAVSRVRQGCSGATAQGQGQNNICPWLCSQDGLHKKSIFVQPCLYPYICQIRICAYVMKTLLFFPIGHKETCQCRRRNSCLVHKCEKRTRPSPCLCADCRRGTRTGPHGSWPDETLPEGRRGSPKSDVRGQRLLHAARPVSGEDHVIGVGRA